MAKTQSTRTASAKKAVEPTKEEILKNAIDDKFASFPVEVREKMQIAAEAELKVIDEKRAKEEAKRSKMIAVLELFLAQFYEAKDKSDAAAEVLRSFVEDNKKEIFRDKKELITSTGTVVLTSKTEPMFEDKLTLNYDDILELVNTDEMKAFLKDKYTKTSLESILDVKAVLTCLQTKPDSTEAEILATYGVVGFVEKESIAFKRPSK